MQWSAIVENSFKGAAELAARIRASAATATILAGTTLATPIHAQDSPAILAQQLANPVAALISVPFQLNYDQDIGPESVGGGLRYWADRRDNGPEGLGYRVVAVGMLP
jgi:hypothetical protein